MYSAVNYRPTEVTTEIVNVQLEVDSYVVCKQHHNEGGNADR